MKCHVPNHLAVFFSYPCSESIGRRNEAVEASREVHGVPIKEVHLFRDHDTLRQIGISSDPHKHGATFAQQTKSVPVASNQYVELEGVPLLPGHMRHPPFSLGRRLYRMNMQGRNGARAAAYWARRDVRRRWRSLVLLGPDRPDCRLRSLGVGRRTARGHRPRTATPTDECGRPIPDAPVRSRCRCRCTGWRPPRPRRSSHVTLSRRPAEGLRAE